MIVYAHGMSGSATEIEMQISKPRTSMYRYIDVSERTSMFKKHRLFWRSIDERWVYFLVSLRVITYNQFHASMFLRGAPTFMGCDEIFFLVI